MSALRLDNDDEVSTAVLCNVMPSWSRMQRRLRKRAKSTSPSSACSLLPSAYDASYTDAWERISEEEEETLGSNRSARGAESKAPDTHAVACTVGKTRCCDVLSTAITAATFARHLGPLVTAQAFAEGGNVIG